jgi:hypothetical protein
MVKALPDGFRSVVGVAGDDAGQDADLILLQQLCRAAIDIRGRRLVHVLEGRRQHGLESDKCQPEIGAGHILDEVGVVGDAGGRDLDGIEHIVQAVVDDGAELAVAGATPGGLDDVHRKGQEPKPVG